MPDVTPLRVCALSLSLALAASPLLAQRSTIRRIIREKAPELSGTVLVARNGKTLFHESFGLANRQFGVPNANDTRFKIASITKLFTSVITLQLLEEGKLALDVPVSKYLPGCVDVTAHQLLNHTSGLTDIARVASKEEAIRKGIEAYQRPHTVEELVARHCGAPLAGQGTFNYNNGDYILLGRIIEVIEGQPFEAVLARRILTPLKMNDTGMLKQHQVVPRLASTYFHREEGGPLANDLPVYDENWFAAGAMYATAGDLRAFAEALYGGRLLEKETLALLLKPGLDRYGYGVWVYSDDFGTSVMRPGQIMGANSVLYRVLEAGLTVIVLSNTDSSNPDALGMEISRALAAH